MWVVREGYEGLVRGNTAHAAKIGSEINVQVSQQEVNINENFVEQPPNRNLLHNLRFGDGDLLLDGTCEYAGGRTLKGRYIVRVGWDDVRAWYTQASFFFHCCISAITQCFLK